MRSTICGMTDPGRARHNNEDTIAFDADAGFALVADGMGGHNAGEVASGMAAAYVSSELRAGLAQLDDVPQPAHIRQLLEQCVAGANRAIYNMAQSGRQYHGMGTTLVAVVVHEATAYVCHLGDSRCYLFRAGQLTQITRDHSVVQEQFDAGLITREQAESAAMQNLVTRALGVAELSPPDLVELPVAVGDLLLLCSDGLSDMVSDAEITDICIQAQNPDLMVKRLIETANHNGGEDNVSAVLIAIEVDKAPKGLLATAKKAFKGMLSR